MQNSDWLYEGANILQGSNNKKPFEMKKSFEIIKSHWPHTNYFYHREQIYCYFIYFFRYFIKILFYRNLVTSQLKYFDTNIV